MVRHEGEGARAGAEGSSLGRAAQVWEPVLNQVSFLSCRGIFITGSSLMGAAIREPRITSKNLIRHVCVWHGSAICWCLHYMPARSRVHHLFPIQICSIIFCEAVAIYGVIVAIILQTKVEAVKPLPDGSYSLGAANAGYAILGAGSVTGWANLACG